MSQITTHILDTARGRPARGVAVTLTDAQGETLGAGVTNEDGRVVGLLSQDRVLSGGTYRMVFATEAYFAGLGVPCFYPEVEVRFCISEGGEHYHIPLLLSDFGYSTYRGS